MIQFYFLSILLNGLIGYMLLFSGSDKDGSIETGMNLPFASGGFRLVVGVLAAVVGVLKLLSPLNGQIPILGDFLPAAAGIAAGFLVVFGFYRENASKVDKESMLDRVGDMFLLYKKMAGTSLLVIAALHFLFAEVLFL